MELFRAFQQPLRRTGGVLTSHSDLQDGHDHSSAAPPSGTEDLPRPITRDSWLSGCWPTPNVLPGARGECSLSKTYFNRDKIPDADRPRSWDSVPTPTHILQNDAGPMDMETVAGRAPTTIGVGSRGRQGITFIHRETTEHIDTKTAGQAYRCPSAYSEEDEERGNREEASFF